MEYTSHKRIESKACPGVSFVVLLMTWARREELRKVQAEAQASLDAVGELLFPLRRAYAIAVAAAKELVKPERDKLIAAGCTAEDAARQVPLGDIEFGDDRYREMMRLGEEYGRIDRQELTPLTVRFGLFEIEGLSYTDKDLGPQPVPATLDLLRSRGPDPLYNEIAEAIARELGLLPEEQTNLKSPSTLAGPVDGSTATGSVITAERSETTTVGVAQNSTDPANAVALTTN
jgi:hypothetical protein